jgi:hypothetical protein
MPQMPSDLLEQAALAAPVVPAFADNPWTRQIVHSHAMQQRFRHNPRLHLIRPLAVPASAAANRENLRPGLHNDRMS